MTITTSITATEIEVLTKAVAVVAAQGFKAINVKPVTGKQFFYEVLCFYGRTDELYTLTVDALEGTYVSSARQNLAIA